MRRALYALAFAAIVAVTSGAVVAAFGWHPVERWNLYAAATKTDSYQFFLGPFPDAHSCDVDKETILRSGGHAVCRGQLTFIAGRVLDDKLAWEFLSPANPFARLCGLRR
jgi:hypothetical protein